MASVCSVHLAVCVVLAAMVSLAYALPPFEIRSSSSQNSEGADAWMNHIQKSEACSVSSPASPPLLCSSTKFNKEPECVFFADLCDGKADCPQAEDERPTLCEALRTVRRRRSLP